MYHRLRGLAASDGNQGKRSADATHMSAFGPKRTSLAAPHMSAFGGRADMTLCGISLSRSLLEVKQTWAVAAHMSAFDPKRTLLAPSREPVGAVRYGVLSRGGGDETARFHQSSCWRWRGLASRNTSSAIQSDAPHRGIDRRPGRRRSRLSGPHRHASASPATIGLD